MAEISAQIVKELREKTGAGMMDCKKALQETQGDMTKAIEYLRQKGLASAGKKAGRVAAEGLVDSYIHMGGRIGVLVEVNCETDFVARNEEFKALVQNVAKQIAACPNVEYVSVNEIPGEIAERERAIAMGSDALKGKPENVKEKIVQGKVDKTLREMCLLDQPFIRDQSITVEELIKQAIAKLGENIQVRRFSRFVVGEGIEKAETNLAAEVAQVSGTPTEEPSPVAASSEAAAPEPAPEPAPELAPEPANPEPAAPEAAPPAKATKAKKSTKSSKSGK